MQNYEEILMRSNILLTFNGHFLQKSHVQIKNYKKLGFSTKSWLHRAVGHVSKYKYSFYVDSKLINSGVKECVNVSLNIIIVLFLGENYAYFCKKLTYTIIFYQKHELHQ